MPVRTVFGDPQWQRQARRNQGRRVKRIRKNRKEKNTEAGGRLERRPHLLDANADSQRVDGALNEDPLAVVAADNNGRQQELL